MRRYFSLSHFDLPKTVGVDQTDGRHTSGDQSGHLSFGPYITLDKGNYYAGFDITFKSTDGRAVIDITGEDKTIASQLVDDVIIDGLGLYGIAFTIERETHRVEVRLEVADGASMILHRLVIFSI